MYFTHGTCFHNQAGFRAQPVVHQVMMHRGCGQQGGDRNVVNIHAAIRQNQDVVTLANGRFGPGTEGGQGSFHAMRTL